MAAGAGLIACLAESARPKRVARPLLGLGRLAQPGTRKLEASERARGERKRRQLAGVATERAQCEVRLRPFHARGASLARAVASLAS
jgi:hypothetical protein